MATPKFIPSGFYRKSRYAQAVIDCSGDKIRTEQQHKDDCDIHTIMRKARTHGIVSHTSKYAGTYGDFSTAPQFKEAMDIIADANSMFESVPSHIRKEFGNDPAMFLDFMQNPENFDAIAEMGLDNSHLPEPEQAVSNPPATDLNPDPESSDTGGSLSSEE
ncbi:internal scaffolding protein [Microviridae sp.]|nr:internal scaffolding protein [Microviridae sp.]